MGPSELLDGFRISGRDMFLNIFQIFRFSSRKLTCFHGVGAMEHRRPAVGSSVSPGKCGAKSETHLTPCEAGLIACNMGASQIEDRFMFMKGKPTVTMSVKIACEWAWFPEKETLTRVA